MVGFNKVKSKKRNKLDGDKQDNKERIRAFELLYADVEQVKIQVDNILMKLRQTGIYQNQNQDMLDLLKINENNA